MQLRRFYVLTIEHQEWAELRRESLVAKDGMNVKPSPTQCLGAAGKICLMAFRAAICVPAPAAVPVSAAQLSAPAREI